MAIPGLEALGSNRSPVIRLQPLDCVCRALGGGNTFYKLVSKGELDRAERLAVMARRMERDLRRSSEAPSGNVAGMVKDFSRALQGGDYEKMPQIALQKVGAWSLLTLGCPQVRFRIRYRTSPHEQERHTAGHDWVHSGKRPSLLVERHVQRGSRAPG